MEAILNYKKKPTLGWLEINIDILDVQETDITFVLKKNNEQVLSFNLKNSGTFTYDWIDCAVAAGESYTYQLFKEGSQEILDELTDIGLFYDHMFLTNGDQQLSIELNPQVSSYKKVVVDSITNTLGGAYPIVRRNGNTKYNQFQISGMISEKCYNREQDASNFDSLSRDLGLYLDGNEEGGSVFFEISKYENNDFFKQFSALEQDFIKEKLFRDAAINFLYDGSPKLFRSPTEGVMLVYLNNISLTPNQQLGRRVWNFSATVNEIGKITVENLKKYGLLKDTIEFETDSALEMALRAEYDGDSNALIVFNDCVTTNDENGGLALIVSELNVFSQISEE